VHACDVFEYPKYIFDHYIKIVSRGTPTTQRPTGS
jgi:hypothetical protein